MSAVAKRSWHTAALLLSQLRGQAAGPASAVQPSAVSFSIVLAAAGAAGDVSSALDMLASMRADGVALDTVAYNAAISACRGEAASRLDVAEALYSEAFAAGLGDVVTTNALLGVLEKAGAWERAGAVLASAPCVNATSFVAAISACGAACQPAAALAHLAAMAAAGVAPSTVACNAALGACSTAGWWAQALRLLDTMASTGPPPDEASLRCAVFACVRARPGPPRCSAAAALARRAEAGAFPGVSRGDVNLNFLVRAADEAAGEGGAMAALAAFLSPSASLSSAAADDVGGDANAPPPPPPVVTHHPPWAPPPPPPCDDDDDGAGAGGGARGSGAHAAAARPPLSFRAVHTEPGFARRPRNVHSLTIWATQPGAVALGGGARNVARHDVPNVPGAFLLTNVVSPHECRQLISAAETMGFDPDEPLLIPRKGQAAPPAAGEAPARAPGAPGIDACAWLLGEADILGPLFERVRPFLPQTLDGCGLLPSSGLNARFRFFRYPAGPVYRPHVDGAWRGAGLGGDGKYVHDAAHAATGARVRSKLTFLLYLNAGSGVDFSGGDTTFFVASEGGGLHARGVSPTAGSVLCFPHGDSPASLVHEGSAVATGVKYVARSDVLYTSAD